MFIRGAAMENQQKVFLTLEESAVEEIYRQNKEKIMKSSTRDQAEGKFHEIKGKLREVAGKLSDNPKLEAEGSFEKVSGQVQGRVGHAKRVQGR
jgi:uncharacterized protein YjbJ (UPF0337 family)